MEHKIHSSDLIYTAQWSGYNVCTPISAATYCIEMKIKKHQIAYLTTKERQELGRTPVLFMATKLRVFNETSGQFTALFLTRCRDDLQPYLRQPKQVILSQNEIFFQPWLNVFSACWAFRNRVATFQWFCSICKVDKQYVNKSKSNPTKAFEMWTAGKTMN